MQQGIDPPTNFDNEAKACKDNANNNLFRIHKIEA